MLDGAVQLGCALVRQLGQAQLVELDMAEVQHLGAAAIGLTEAIDAVCVVVSEERGTVSLVLAGKVVPVADPDDLRERLQEALERGMDPGARRSTGGARA